MKRTLKKTMSILLAFTLLFGTLAFGLFNIQVKARVSDVMPGVYKEGFFTYGVGAISVSILDVDTSISGNITIPSSYGGYPVTSIGEKAFENCENLSGVTIPDSIINIGNKAFYGCNNLKSISIPDSVTNIGDYAFYECLSLESIIIPGKVSSIGESTFGHCHSLASVIFSDNLTSIGFYAFSGCQKLSTLTVPNSVKSIGRSAFSYCTSLTNITIPDTVTIIESGAFGYTGYYNDENNWENRVLYIGNHLIEAQETLGKSYEIKEGTVTIADNAFKECADLTSITIPDSVISIGEDAFENTGYYNDASNWENGVLYIGEHLIKAGTSLDYCKIKKGTVIVADYAFSNCSELNQVIIPDSITNIGDYAFASSDITLVHIPAKTKNIGIDVFHDCRMANIYICSDTEDCYAKTYAEENNEKFMICDNHGMTKPEVTTTEIPTQPTIVPEIEPTTKMSTTKPVEVPTTTELIEVPTTAKPAETEPSTTKPVVTKPTTKPVETTKPTTIPTTKPVETTKPTTESTKPVEIPTTTKPVEATKPTTTKPESTTKPEPIEEEIIKKPSTTEVKYGETLILHADFDNIPADAKIEWSVEGNGVTIVPSADGKTCAVTSTATGDVTITAKYTDANGVEHISEQEIESNASFWQKIVSFFKNLFGMNRIIEQVIKF